MKRTARAKIAEINEEQQRLKELISGNDSNAPALLDPLIRNAAFIQTALNQLQEEILTNGMKEEYQGREDRKGREATYRLQDYNALIKNYNAVLYTLAELMTAGNNTDTGKLSRSSQSLIA